MSKAIDTRKELKELFLLGPDIELNHETRKALENRDDCVIVGDGWNPIDPGELKQILKEKNLKIGPNTCIDINGHGHRINTEKYNGQHSIVLFNGIGLTTSIFKILRNIVEPNIPLYAHLWSCHGGSANKSVKYLGEESILITHIEAKEA